MTNRERKYYNFRNEHINEIDMIYKKELYDEYKMLNQILKLLNKNLAKWHTCHLAKSTAYLYKYFLFLFHSLNNRSLSNPIPLIKHLSFLLPSI